MNKWTQLDNGEWSLAPEHSGGASVWLEPDGWKGDKPLFTAHFVKGSRRLVSKRRAALATAQKNALQMVRLFAEGVLS